MKCSCRECHRGSTQWVEDSASSSSSEESDSDEYASERGPASDVGRSLPPDTRTIETLENGQYVIPTGDGGWRRFPRSTVDPWYCKHCDFNRETDFDTVALHEENCAARRSDPTAPQDPPETASLSREQLHQSLQQFDSLSDTGQHESAKPEYVNLSTTLYNHCTGVALD